MGKTTCSRRYRGGRHVFRLPPSPGKRKRKERFLRDLGASAVKKRSFMSKILFVIVFMKTCT
jgi:hypothetical protein